MGECDFILSQQKRRYKKCILSTLKNNALELSKNKISGDEEDCRALFSELELGTNALNYDLRHAQGEREFSSDQ